MFFVQRQLDILIGKRMGEGLRRRGFFVVELLTGQNKQNRLGRVSTPQPISPSDASALIALD